MDTAVRRDELLALLRRRPDWRVEDLARELHVSSRTVLRDLRRLRDRGFEISAMAGPGGGVRLEPTSVLVTSQLDGEEVVALVLSVAIAHATPGTPFAAGADRALAKIQSALPFRRAEQLQQLMERILVDQPAPKSALPAYRIHPDLVTRFEAAFTARKLLGFGYVDRHGVTTERRVEPHGLLVRPPLWYIIAWDPTKAAARLFRADRITHPELRDETFVPRPYELVTRACPDARPSSWQTDADRSLASG